MIIPISLSGILGTPAVNTSIRVLVGSEGRYKGSLKDSKEHLPWNLEKSEQWPF